MRYKVLYYEPRNVIDYAKWLNEQYEKNDLELVAVNVYYHIFVAAEHRAQATSATGSFTQVNSE